MSTDDDDEPYQRWSGQIVRRKRQDQDSSDGSRQYRLPVILLVLGFGTALVSAFARAGDKGALVASVHLVLVLLVQLPITIAGMYLLAAVLGISYGLLKMAILKLAAITVFAAGLELAGGVLGHPFVALIIILPFHFYLFGLLFDLDIWETLISLLGLCLLHAILTHFVGSLAGVV